MVCISMVIFLCRKYFIAPYKCFVSMHSNKFAYHHWCFRGNSQRQEASSWRHNVSILMMLGASGFVSWMYFTWTDDLTHTLVSSEEILTQQRFFIVDCSEDYKKYKLFTGMLGILITLFCK